MPLLAAAAWSQPTGRSEVVALVFDQKAEPKGSEVLLWGILPQLIMVIPNIEALHSTI